MEAIKSILSPLGTSTTQDTLKLVVIGGTVETARRASMSAWNGFVDSFFLTAHFSEEDYPYDWLMHWLAKQPSWGRSREFESTTRSVNRSGSTGAIDDDDDGEEDDDSLIHGRKKRKVAFMPSVDNAHTIYYRGHWLRITRTKSYLNHSPRCALKISVVARNNDILKKLVLEAKREYEKDAEYRVHILLGDSTCGCWRRNGTRQKRPMGSMVPQLGIKDMLSADCKEFLCSEGYLVSATHEKSQCGACCSHLETQNPVQAHFTLPPIHPKYNKHGQRFKYDGARNAHREDDPISPPSTDFDTIHTTTDEQYDDGGSTSASSANIASHMFSSNSCFMGGSYYHVRGDAHFSPTPSQISPGLKILHRNISASACHNSRERYPPPRCHPSTRKEILDAIIDHIAGTSSSSKIIHVFGSEGTGKSAIAQTIAEYYKSIGTLGACFFFSRASSERNTDKNLIATLAYQLCVNIPGLKPFIVKAVEEDLSIFQKDVDTQIEKLIISPMVQANDEGVIHPILIVVDGINECEGMKEQRAFLRAISGAMGRHDLPLYFVITSRPETHIVNWVNQDPTIFPISHRLDLDLNPTHTKRDIEVYVRSEFERIRSVHHMPESLVWPSQANIETLVAKTNTLFRYASEIMAFIDDQQDTPQNRLEDILRTSTRSSSGGHA